MYLGPFIVKIDVICSRACGPPRNAIEDNASKIALIVWWLLLLLLLLLLDVDREHCLTANSKQLGGRASMANEAVCSSLAKFDTSSIRGREQSRQF